MIGEVEGKWTLGLKIHPETEEIREVPYGIWVTAKP